MRTYASVAALAALATVGVWVGGTQAGRTPIVSTHSIPDWVSPACSASAQCPHAQPNDIAMYPPDVPCRIAFVGDSITANWQTVGAAA
jgi:hypothetical protein